MKNIILSIIVMAYSTVASAEIIVFDEVNRVTYRARAKDHPELMEITILGSEGYVSSQVAEAYLRFRSNNILDQISFKACLDLATKALDPAFSFHIESQSIVRRDAGDDAISRRSYIVLANDENISSLICGLGRRRR
jgi:hypothetical protein